VSTNFYHAFVSITNFMFAYAGHFIFFILISEMKQPAEAKKAAWVLETLVTLYVWINNLHFGPTLTDAGPDCMSSLRLSCTSTWDPSRLASLLIFAHPLSQSDIWHRASKLSHWWKSLLAHGGQAFLYQALSENTTSP